MVSDEWKTADGQDYSKTKGKLLILHGTADTSITMADFSRLADELEAKGVPHEMITYGIDRLGSEYYDIRIRNIDSGDEFEETIPSTGGSAAWAADSKSFYYVERDANQRPKRVKHHLLGTDPDDDLLVYEEDDDTLFLHVDKSQSGAYIFIVSEKGTTSVSRYLRADAEPNTEPTLIAPQVDDELYFVEHHGEHFYIRTNASDAVDFKIVRAPVDRPGRENWENWLEHRNGVYISAFTTFADRIVRLERENALPRIVVSDYTRENFFKSKREIIAAIGTMLANPKHAEYGARRLHAALSRLFACERRASRHTGLRRSRSARAVVDGMV